MTEFTQGIQGAFKKILTSSSLGLALIYTIGHVIIAMTVVSVMTGASLWEAGGIVNDLNKFDHNNIDIRASSGAINDKMLENLKNF